MANFRSMEDMERSSAAAVQIAAGSERKPEPTSVAKIVLPPEDLLAETIRKKTLFRAFSSLSSPFMNRKLNTKLKEKPVDFFKDAKSPVTRAVAKVLLNGQA